MFNSLKLSETESQVPVILATFQILHSHVALGLGVPVPGAFPFSFLTATRLRGIPGNPCDWFHSCS